MPTSIFVHCDVIKEGDVQEIQVPRSATTADVLKGVLERYGLQKKWEAYCLAFVKGIKKSRSFRSSNTKPRVLQPSECPMILGFHQLAGRLG